MNKKRLLFALACLTAMMITACTQKYPGYKQTKSGLYYKFHSQNLSAIQPKLTDFLKVEMTCYLNDSLYYDWQGSQKEVYTQLREPVFAGDLQEAYAMMHVGDSASFYVKADSIAVLYYEQDPKAVGLKPEDFFRYEVKLVEVKTEKEFQDDIEKLRERRKADSEKAFLDYLEANNVTDSTPSGLYYTKLKTTRGAQPKVGQKVLIKFVATYLDGTPLGDSDQLGGQYEVEYGKGMVLQGLDEGIGLMREGEKARFVLPYPLAYGESTYGYIPAYSNLVFDVELLDIMDK